MAIDRTDISREEAKRDDNKRLEKSRQQSSQTAGAQKSSEFQSMLQSRQKHRLKEKEVREGKTESSRAEEKKGSLFSRVIQVITSKEEGAKRENKEILKKEETKQEDTKKEKTTLISDTKTKAQSEEGHLKVVQRESGSDGQDQKGKGGGGGFSDGDGGDSSQQRSGQSFSDSGSRQQKNLDSDKQNIFQKSKSNFKVSANENINNSSGGSQSGSRHFNKQVFDKVVDSVALIVNSEGESEMDISLADSYFQGLKLKAKQSADGVVITFVCPNREVKNTFLMERPQIYERLKEKNINVSKIEVL